jgi:hypothetical protein
VATKSECEWNASTPMSATNATTCRTISQKMIRATIFTENSDSAATISMRMTDSQAMERLLPRWLPALAIAVEWNAEPRPLSMNGVNCAAKCALVDST